MKMLASFSYNGLYCTDRGMSFLITFRSTMYLKTIQFYLPQWFPKRVPKGTMAHMKIKLGPDEL